MLPTGVVDIRGRGGVGNAPTRPPRQLERRVEQFRRSRKLGPARIAGILEMNPSTVHRMLCRQGLNRVAWMDRPSGTAIGRRIVHDPAGRVGADGREEAGSDPTRRWLESVGTRQRVHHGRLRVRAHRDRQPQSTRVQRGTPHEKAVTAIGFWARAHHWFATMAPRSRRCRPVTKPVTRRSRSRPRSKRPASRTGGCRPADRYGTAKLNVSTGPARRVGLRTRLPIRNRTHRRA